MTNDRRPRQRALRGGAVVAAVLALASGILAAPAQATIESAPDNLIERPGYDYAPSIIEGDGVRQYWWCSPAQTDAIFYAEQDLSTGEMSPIQQVLTPDITTPSWDQSYICDPSVIKGSFLSPDDGLTYSYAMYYTATDRGPGTPWAGGDFDGTNNRIGVAWSNDGVNWVRYSQNPVISPITGTTDKYGAGQATSYSADGAAGITISHHDNSVDGTTNLWTRTSTDGIHFSAPTSLSVQGLAPVGEIAQSSNFDVAFDHSTGYWYGAFPLPPRAGDRETYRMVLAKMPEADFPSGTWQKLGFIDSVTTGSYLNHSPGLVRDKWGDAAITSPNVDVMFSNGGNDPGDWDLRLATWSAEPTTKPLISYGNSSIAKHQVTTGTPAPGYTALETLGHLPQTPSGTATALFGCLAGEDYFLSPDEACEGQLTLGVVGYAYPSPPAGEASVPLYRCITDSDHFVSTSPGCDGWTQESLLGYALQD